MLSRCGCRGSSLATLQLKTLSSCSHCFVEVLGQRSSGAAVSLRAKGGYSPVLTGNTGFSVLAKSWGSALQILGCRCSQGAQARWLQRGCPQWLLLCISASAEDFWCTTWRMPIPPLLGDCRHPSCMMPTSHAVLVRAGHTSGTGKSKCKGKGCS